MEEVNRFSAEYWDGIVQEAELIVLQEVERQQEMTTQGGRVYGQVKVTPEIAAQIAAMPPEPPPMPAPAAQMPPTGVM